MDRQIEEVLSTVNEGDLCEIAFFGGSFTGIDRGLMIELLSKAKRYVDEGRVSSIRLSTRPDYIDEEILMILREYGVGTVELGLQSMDDDVLRASERGHDRATAIRACRLIKEYGFSLVGQMMIGLPESDGERERRTAEEICRVGADGARIYPTVVFRGTTLAKRMREGRYRPLSEEEAVKRSADALEILEAGGVPCIRVGLCASESLRGPAEAVGGATDGAIGEKVMSEVFLRRIEKALPLTPKTGRNLKIYVPVGAVSKAVGQKRRNIEKICEKYALGRVKVLEKKELLRYNIILEYYN
jgi:histone acetyltransferase (RNA polymerase elongator complex component)